VHHDRGGMGSEINPFLSESAWPLSVVAATYEEDRHNFSSSKRIAKNTFTLASTTTIHFWYITPC